MIIELNEDQADKLDLNPGQKIRILESTQINERESKEKIFKIGDSVVYTNKQYSDNWKKQFGVSLYKKRAKIININNKYINPYLLEFKEWIDGSDGEGKGKDGHCRWVEIWDFSKI